MVFKIFEKTTFENSINLSREKSTLTFYPPKYHFLGKYFTKKTFPNNLFQNSRWLTLLLVWARDSRHTMISAGLSHQNSWHSLTGPMPQHDTQGNMKLSHWHQISTFLCTKQHKSMIHQISSGTKQEKNCINFHTYLQFI